MRLSIIIPAYNVEKYIVKCLDSLYKQSLKIENFEVIVINDGSTDNTLPLILDYSKIYSNITVHTQVNSGVGSARNTGLLMAKGDYVYFIDPDDYLANNTLLSVLQTSERNGLEILTFNSFATESYELLSSDKQAKSLNGLNVISGIQYMGERKYKNEIWWYIINRGFLLNSRITFIEGKWMEDAIFTASLFLKAKSMAHIDLDVHRHVKVPNSAMTSTVEAHYKKVIYDNANAAIVYDDLIKRALMKKKSAAAVKRMKARQESFVFFLVIRAIKSNLRFGQIWEILERMKSIGIYPLRNFTKIDYEMMSYKLLTPIINNKKS